MQGLNLQSASWCSTWPRNVHGYGLAMIFVPLTGITQANIPPYRATYPQRPAELKLSLIFKGNAALQGEHSALGNVNGEASRQAGALAFSRTFFSIGLDFLVIITFLLLLKRPAHQIKSSMTH